MRFFSCFFWYLLTVESFIAGINFSVPAGKDNSLLLKQFFRGFYIELYDILFAFSGFYFKV